ncbi:hypothetical protein OKW38_001586 [Paraburkholderia sp. MM5496-R1]
MNCSASEHFGITPSITWHFETVCMISSLPSRIRALDRQMVLFHDVVETAGSGANRLGESVKVFSPTFWWSVMIKRKGLKALFDGRHFDREIIILCVR